MVYITGRKRKTMKNETDLKNIEEAVLLPEVRKNLKLCFFRNRVTEMETLIYALEEALKEIPKNETLLKGYNSLRNCYPEYFLPPRKFEGDSVDYVKPESYKARGCLGS